MRAACAIRLPYKCYIHIIQNNVGRRQGRIQEGYYLLWWVGQKQLNPLVIKASGLVSMRIHTVPSGFPDVLW